MALQFREQKSDIIENERYQKNNGAIVKLIYVYEGMEQESPKSKQEEVEQELVNIIRKKTKNEFEEKIKE